MKNFILFFVCLFIYGLYGQAYMSDPPGKVPAGPSTTSPCGQGTYVGFYPISAGRFIPTQWTSSTDGNNNGLVSFNLLDNNENFLMSLANVSFSNNQYNLRIPPSVSVGTYILQWTWIDSSNNNAYFTCSELNVTEDLIKAIVVTFGQTYTAYLQSNFTYYEIDGIGNLYSLLISGSITSGSVPLILVAYPGLQTVPNLNTYDEMDNTAASTDFVFGTCPTSSSWFVGVVGAPGYSGNDTYQISFTEYKEIINVGTTPYTSEPHTGNRYYITQSFTDDVSARKVVISATENLGNPDFELSKACYSPNGRVVGSAVSPYVSCIQLGTAQGNKYIKVGPVPVSYTISTENGLCGAMNLQVPFLFIIFTCIYFYI